nr:type IV secretion system DNA-binding domain-containing protein [Shigella flexneri]
MLGMGEKESRINVFIDELESLQFLPNLNDALTKGRKSGSVCLCWLSNLFSAG